MKRDFHFRDENSIPVIRKKKPKNPAPPMNARRNPSTAIQDYSEYDEAQPERKAEREEPVYIDDEQDISSDDDIKLYEPKRRREETEEEKRETRDPRRFLLAAAIMGAVGLAFLATGIIIAINYYNMYY